MPAGVCSVSVVDHSVEVVWGGWGLGEDRMAVSMISVAMFSATRGICSGWEGAKSKVIVVGLREVRPGGAVWTDVDLARHRLCRHVEEGRRAGLRRVMNENEGMGLTGEGARDPSTERFSPKSGGKHPSMFKDPLRDDNEIKATASVAPS